MFLKNSLSLFLFFITFVCVSLFLPQSTHAQVSTSCWTTDFGNPPDNFFIPSECLTTKLQGIKLPPNLNRSLCKKVEGNPKGAWDPDEGTSTIAGVAGFYCRMPDAPNGEYELLWRKEWDRYGPQVWGSEELIAVLYTVAVNWRHEYCTKLNIPLSTCKARLYIRDMTSPYHFSHKWGSAADLHATTNGTDCAANFTGVYGCSKSKYNASATITLGKILLDTGYVRLILHNGDTIPINGSSVNREINNYAKQTLPTRFQSRNAVQHVDGHDDHFHIYLDRNINTILYNDKDEAKLQLCTKVVGVGCGK